MATRGRLVSLTFALLLAVGMIVALLFSGLAATPVSNFETAPQTEVAVDDDMPQLMVKWERSSGLVSSDATTYTLRL